MICIERDQDHYVTETNLGGGRACLLSHLDLFLFFTFSSYLYTFLYTHLTIFDLCQPHTSLTATLVKTQDKIQAYTQDPLQKPKKLPQINLFS
jgi:hypothetical protein